MNARRVRMTWTCNHCRVARDIFDAENVDVGTWAVQGVQSCSTCHYEDRSGVVTIQVSSR